MPDHPLVPWSARLALFLFACGIRWDGRRAAWGRWCYAVGSGVMLIHVLLAFHLAHGWSHAAAVAETARQTRELVGLDWGGGVWVNWAFCGVWAADAVARCGWPRRYAKRLGWVRYGVAAALGFVAFNGAVVLAGPVAAGCGVAATVWAITGGWGSPPFAGGEHAA